MFKNGSLKIVDRQLHALILLGNVDFLPFFELTIPIFIQTIKDRYFIFLAQKNL